MLTNFNNCSKFKQQFIPERLPNAVEYYASLGLKLSGSGEWKSALCPFHEDKRPSLRINTKSGGFICMSCHEKGGDVIAFHIKRFDLSFKEACIALGAWGEK